MATYGEPNYKFPTLARAVPNVTTGGTIMATVDLEKIREIECSSENVGTVGALIEFIRGLQWEMEERGKRTALIHAAHEHAIDERTALIRRVERLTEIAHHHLDCSVCREILREIPSFFGMFFIDWHKAMWDDQANMRPW